MSTFGLWYFRWNGNTNKHESRLRKSINDAEGTANKYDFKDQGFDYAIALGNSGFDIRFTRDGYLDGKKFARDVQAVFEDIPYYITIPYYTYNPSRSRPYQPRDTPNGSNEYWSRWIDGVLDVAESSLKGFYWSQESAWMLHDNLITITALEALSDKIHSHGLKFIWIPHARTKERDRTDIPEIYSRHIFNYIFVQPNYYQYSTIASAQGELPYTYDELRDYVDWILEGQLYMAMEADEGVITGCGKCRQCSLNSPDACKELACDYIRAQKDVMGKKFYHRVYYFGVTLDVINKLNSYCRIHIGENYV